MVESETKLGDLFRLAWFAPVPGPNERYVFLNLVLHANWKTAGEARPAQATIARECLMSRTSVQRALRWLSHPDVMYIREDRPSTPRRPASYTIEFERVAAVVDGLIAIRVPAIRSSLPSAQVASARVVPRTTLVPRTAVVPRTTAVPWTMGAVPRTSQGGPKDQSRVVPGTTDQALDPSLEPSHANTARTREMPERGSGRKTRSGHPAKWFSFAEVTAEMLKQLPDQDLWRHLHVRCRSDYRKADERFAAIRGYDFERPRRAARE
jgi:hypothetical protein